MPFTPLHFGPALAVRELVGHKRFGIWAFTTTQVLFDLEPAVRMFFDLPGELHETTHNPTFGVIYALIAIAALWKWEKWSAITGAVFGSVTHLWLDAMYHVDVARTMLHLMPGQTEVEVMASTEATVICYLGFFFWLLFWGIRYAIKARKEQADG
jgi:hypothetical protein